MKYTPGPMLGQLSGSQGSTTASHNRYGSYVRNRTIPVNSRDGRQFSRRATLTTLSQSWRTLTASQRLSWDQLGDLLPSVDTQGNSINLSGNAMYCKVNADRTRLGLATLTSAPPLGAPAPNFTTNTIVATGGANTIALTYTNTNGLVTNFIQVWATPTLSQGVRYFAPEKFRFLGFILGNAASPSALAGFYSNIFGTGWNTQVGMQIAFKFVNFSADGLKGSQALTVPTIV